MAGGLWERVIHDAGCSVVKLSNVVKLSKEHITEPHS
jgi:hypothetical protein